MIYSCLENFSEVLLETEICITTCRKMLKYIKQETNVKWWLTASYWHSCRNKTNHTQGIKIFVNSRMRLFNSIDPFFYFNRIFILTITYFDVNNYVTD